MIIFSHTPTPRLQYVVDFLAQYYRSSIKLVFDEEKYVAHKDAHKINYSYHRILPNEIWIHSHVLLFESTIRPVKIECFTWHGYKAFFRAEGDTGFDLLAALFFLLVRYEEYLPHQKDAYGLFSHQSSIAFKEDFLHLPLINIWLENFRKLAVQKFPDIPWPAPSFSLQPTYDIDIAWSFRNKGFKRNAGALLKLFATGKWRQLAQRVHVLRNKGQDPYDAYEWMHALHKEFELKPLYFFLVAEQTSRIDKNISIKNSSFKELIVTTADVYATGLHPSWASGDHTSLLRKEKAWLEATINKQITASRQHYIRFQLPTTFRHLLAAGITHDYSMGYGSTNGFRASVATPFYWYDLKNESSTRLLLHPFCFMDANSYYEESKTATETLDELLHYYKEISAIGGTMILIWHNSFLGTDPAFEGWKETYREFIKEVSDTVKWPAKKMSKEPAS